MDDIRIVPTEERYAESYNAAVAAVALERRYIGFVEPPTIESTRTFVGRILSGGGFQMLAVATDDAVVGWCDIIRYSMEGFRHTGGLGMGILAAYRGRGLGRRLAVETIAAARRAGIERVELQVFASNERAIALYRTLGFVAEGIKRRSRKLDGEYDDTLMMALLPDPVPHITDIVKAELPESWLRGPLPGLSPSLQPVGHALVGALEDVQAAGGTLTPEQLWLRPGGAASVGFHLLHLSGSTDRLLTYARGEPLSDAQRSVLSVERTLPQPLPSGESLLATWRETVRLALDRLAQTTDAMLDEPRSVGRTRLPSTVRGLLYHAAEHAQRHTGQIITTAKIVR